MSGWIARASAFLRTIGERIVDLETKYATPNRFLIIALAAWTISAARGEAFSVGKTAPDISGGPWINSQPLALADLKGQVVLVEFWTYG
jgi:hypothetical protein